MLAGGGILRWLTLSHPNLEAGATARHTPLAQPCQWLGSHLEHIRAGPRLREAWPFKSVTLGFPLTQSAGAFRLGVLHFIFKCGYVPSTVCGTMGHDPP